MIVASLLIEIRQSEYHRLALAVQPDLSQTNHTLFVIVSKENMLTESS